MYDDIEISHTAAWRVEPESALWSQLNITKAGCLKYVNLLFLKIVRVVKLVVLDHVWVIVKFDFINCWAV